MDKEEDIKLKIFNTINMKNNTKKKYFRIEKNKIYYKKENKSKAIFKTKKDLLNRKTFREIEIGREYVRGLRGLELCARARLGPGPIRANQLEHTFKQFPPDY